MKKPPDNPEFARFTDAMRQIMGVSKTELQRRIEAEKTEKKGKRIKSSASPVPASPSTSEHSYHNKRYRISVFPVQARRGRQLSQDLDKAPTTVLERVPTPLQSSEV